MKFYILGIAVVIFYLIGGGKIVHDINTDSKNKLSKTSGLEEIGGSDPLCSEIRSFVPKDDLFLTNTITSYSLDTSSFFQINLMWINPTKDNYILWLNDKYNSDSLSPEIMTHLYFFTRKGDFRLIDLFYDTFSKESYEPYLYETFLKILKPGDRFILTVFMKNEGQNLDEITKNVIKQMIYIKWSPALRLPDIHHMGILDYKDITMTVMLSDLDFNAVYGRY